MQTDQKINQTGFAGPAQYGGPEQAGGGAAGAVATGLARTGENDANTGQMNKGMADANSLAGSAQTRGPQAVQNAGDAQNAAGGANGNQAGAIELARRQAMGQAPSAGAYQLQAGLNQASAQQSAMAAGARGSSALATGQNNAAANISNMQQQAYTGAGMLRSQDMAAGRGLYNSLTNAARDQAGQKLGEANNMGLTNQQMNDNFGLGMGNAAVGFGGVSNGFNGEDLQNTQTALVPQDAQDDANQAYQEQLAANEKQRVGEAIKN